MASEITPIDTSLTSSPPRIVITHFDPAQMNIDQFCRHSQFFKIRTELSDKLDRLIKSITNSGTNPDKLTPLTNLKQCIERAPNALSDLQLTQLFGEFCVEMETFDSRFSEQTEVDYESYSKLRVVQQQLTDFSLDNPHLLSDLKRINQQLQRLTDEPSGYPSCSDSAFASISESPEITTAIKENLDSLPKLESLNIDTDDMSYEAESLKHHHGHLAYVLSSRVGYPQQIEPDTSPKYDELFVQQLLDIVKTVILPEIGLG